MSSNAYPTNIWSRRPDDEHGVVLAAVIAGVFFALAATSFTIEQLITLCLR